MTTEVAMTLLVPVLQMTPHDYAIEERATPAGSIADNPRGWDQYWSESLQDAGIVGLSAWPNSWLVPLEKLTDETALRAIARHEFRDGRPEREDLPSILGGGYILVEDERCIRPGCCGDLDNLEDWRQAAESCDDGWTMVWIGHPWTYVRGRGETLQFADPTEEEDPQLTEALQLSRQSLSAAIDGAERVRDAFFDRLMAAVYPGLEESEPD